DLSAQLGAREGELKQARAQIATHDARQRAAGDELQRRANEVNYLQQQVVTRDDQLKNAAAQVERMRATMVEASINANAERERNERLLQENERLTKDFQQLRQVSTSTSMRREGPKKNPPVEEINGRVTRTDPDTGYITLNVGSDAGLSKGNT